MSPPPSPSQLPPKTSTQESKPDTLAIKNSTKNSNTIRLLLSKSIYPLNSPIVGSIRIPPPPPPPPPSPPSSLKVPQQQHHHYRSIQLYAAGRCRLDPRWHDVPSLTRIYGTHPLHGDLPNGTVEEKAVDCYFGRKTTKVGSVGSGSVVETNGDRIPCVCFWSTNVITLYDNDGDGDGNIRVPVVKGYVHGKPEPLEMEGGEWFERGKKLAGCIGGDGDGDGDGDGADYNSDDFDNDDGDGGDGDGDIPQVGYDIVDDSNDVRSGDDLNDLQSSRPDLLDDCEYSDCSSTSGVSSKQDNDALSISEPTLIPMMQSSEQEDHNVDQDAKRQTQKKLYFTFRADLPNDLPPTANATCARYFYSVVLVAQTMDGKSIVFQAPFTVTPPPPQQVPTSLLHPLSQAKIRIGTIHAIHHSTPHPIAIPITAQIELEPSRVSVQRRNCGWGGSGTVDDVRSIPLEDGGRRCCVLTIVGGKVMYPGDKVLLQFDFLDGTGDGPAAAADDDTNSRRKVLQCHQVSACLYGEEKAIGIDGVTKRRTKYNVFDTSHTEVEHGYTESVSLSLALPLDNCPVTLSTDLVEATITCRIDVTVSDGSPKLVSTTTATTEGGGGGSSSNAYRSLSVEFPCRVVRYAPEGDDTAGEGLAPEVRSKIAELASGGGGVHAYNGGGGEEGRVDGSCHKVLNPDVLNDLTMLSLHMIETGGD